MKRIASRVASVHESVTLSIDAKAKALRAQGEPVIIYGAGEPDFPTPEHIVKAAQYAATNPRFHKYTPTSGLPELRDEVAKTVGADRGMTLARENVLITNGGKQAVDHAMTTLLDLGDELLLPSPYWTTYPELCQLAGGVPVVIPTEESTDFKVTVELLDTLRTSRTKALLLVSPSNPTGSVYSAEELAAIGQWCLAHGIWVISDEIYEYLTYGVDHVSIATVVPEIQNQLLIISGVAKTFAMTGWRVGWLVGPVDVIAAAGNRHSHASSNVCNVAQMAALAAIQGDRSLVDEMRATFNRRRQLMVELVNEIPGMSCREPHGAFYVFVNVQRLIDRHIGPWIIDSSLALAEVLLEETKVAMVPGEAFGAPGYLRMSYAVSDDDIRDGLGRVKELLEHHRDLKTLPDW